MQKEDEQAINDRLYYRFTVFLELVNVNHLSRDLRKILIVYLKHELKVGVDIFFPELMLNLSNLFALLDDIEEVYSSPQEEKDS